MTTKAFAQLKGISLDKAKAMAPYIKGATQCPNCKVWNIPKNAKPIYIPDGRRYSRHARPYCYVLDAIELDMEINFTISCIDEDIYKTVIRELYKNECIVRKENSNVNSLYHLDYMVSLKTVDWQNKKSEEKTKLIYETIQSCADAVGETMKTVGKLSMVL